MFAETEINRFYCGAFVSEVSDARLRVLSHLKFSLFFKCFFLCCTYHFTVLASWIQISLFSKHILALARYLAPWSISFLVVITSVEFVGHWRDFDSHIATSFRLERARKI